MKGFAGHGFADFVLCLGYKGWVIKRYFLDYHLAQADLSVCLGSPGAVEVHASNPAEDWRVTLAETGPDAMTGCRVKRIEKYISAERFLLTYGDGVADVDVADLVAFHRKHGKMATVTAVQAPGRFGEIELDGSQVTQFLEKPLTARGRISGGFFVFERRFLERLWDDPGLILEHGPLAQLARDGELMAYPHDGFWHPMDNSRDYRYLNDLWDQGRAPWTIWEAPRLARAA
jgi:glucose-1-phosphate cytidylyltransferase